MANGNNLTLEEEKVWRAYRLGIADGRDAHYHGLAEIMPAIASEHSLDALLESREERLERELRAERVALRALREEKPAICDKSPLAAHPRAC